MSDDVRLKKVFSHVLGMDVALVTDGLKYNATPKWDSIVHMTLITAIEDEFDITLETADIIDMNSFEKAKEMVEKRLAHAQA